MYFLSNLTIFYQAGPRFGVKYSNVDAILAKKHICMVIECRYTIIKSILHNEQGS